MFLGPVLACLFSVFGFCIKYEDTPNFFKWLYHISYFRAGFHGITYSMYGLNRSELYCPDVELYCHYTDPSKFLREMGIIDINIFSNVTIIIFICCILHCATYLSLWVRLNKR